MPVTYELIVGNRLYFSWSLAAWLMLNRFDTGAKVTTTYLRPEEEDGIGPLLEAHAPARTVPTLCTPEGAVLCDSMAIAEELATRFPHAGFWPSDPLARGTARALACEMHASFRSLRSDWPVNLRVAYEAQTPPSAVASELDRLETIWTHARHVTQSQTPWLCGPYSIADAIFAPMATRLATYGFDTRPTTKDYVAAHLCDPALRRWRAMGLVSEPRMPKVERPFPERPWPGPTPRKARAVDGTDAQNTACPYSGKPVTHCLEIDGRRFGFCNAFCRGKTLADPEAWPQFMALLDRS